MQILYAYQNPYGRPGTAYNPFMRRGYYWRQRFRNRRQGGCCLVNLLVLLVIAFIIGLCIHTFAFPLIPLGPTTISVRPHVTLVVDSSTYTQAYKDAPIIHIHAGSAQDKVVVQAANPWIFPLPYNQPDDKSSVILNMRNLPASNVNVDITVPTNTDLKITTNSADIQVEGITGQFVLSSNGGAITVKQSVIHGPSLFNNNTGNITATHNVIDGRITFSENSGNLSFDNDINPNGIYQLYANGGTIDCTFPGSAAVHIDATVNNKGSISTDIPGLQVQKKELHGDLGNIPRASLILYNNQGNIILHTRKGA